MQTSWAVTVVSWEELWGLQRPCLLGPPARAEAYDWNCRKAPLWADHKMGFHAGGGSMSWLPLFSAKPLLAEVDKAIREDTL